MQHTREIDAAAHEVGPRIVFERTHPTHRVLDVELLIPQPARQFLPAQRHRNTGTRFGARTERRHEQTAVTVLQVVDVYLLLAASHDAGDRRDVGTTIHDDAR